MIDGRFQVPAWAGSFRLLRTAACRYAEVDGGSACHALGLVALGAEEGEGEVQPFDLTGSALPLGPAPAGEEVLLEFVEGGQHLGVDRQRRAADAG